MFSRKASLSPYFMMLAVAAFAFWMLGTLVVGMMNYQQRLSTISYFIECETPKGGLQEYVARGFEVSNDKSIDPSLTILLNDGRRVSERFDSCSIAEIKN